MRRRTLALLFPLLVLGLMACEPDEGLGVFPTSGSSPASKPTPAASPPPGTGGDPDLKGRTENSNPSPSPSPSASVPEQATVISVGVSPAQATLNLPALDGDNSAGLPTFVQLAVLVGYSDSTTRSTASEVTWSTNPAGIVSVTADGLVSAQSTGTVVVTAASKQDPAVRGSTTLTVEGNGALDVVID